MLSYSMPNYVNIQAGYGIIENNFQKSYTTCDSARQLDRPPGNAIRCTQDHETKWCEGKP